MFLKDDVCPVCGKQLDYLTHIYVRDGECLGCEYCVDEDYIDDDEPDDDELEADFYDMLNDLAREERVLGI